MVAANEPESTHQHTGIAQHSAFSSQHSALKQSGDRKRSPKTCETRSKQKKRWEVQAVQSLRVS